MITLPAHALRAAVDRIIDAADRKTTLPILQHILLQVQDNELRLTATDLERQISTLAPLDLGSGHIGEQPNEQGHTIPAHKLHSIARALLGDASVTISETCQGQIVLRAGRSRYRLQSLSGADFPLMDASAERNPAAEIRIAPALLARVIATVAPAMAQSDVRFYLNGMLVRRDPAGGRIELVATDGHRLHYARISADPSVLVIGDEALEREIIIPVATIFAMRKLIDPKADQDERVIITAAASNLRVEIGDSTLQSKLVDGRYPDFERVIPKNNPHSVRIPRQEASNTLAQLAIISADKVKGVRATFGPSEVMLESTNTEHEEAASAIAYPLASGRPCTSLRADHDSPGIVIGFNIHYLADALNALNTPDVDLAIDNSDVSAIITPTDTDDILCVVMPMRL